MVRFREYDTVCAMKVPSTQDDTLTPMSEMTRSYCTHEHDEDLDCELDCAICSILAEQDELDESGELQYEAMLCLDCGRNTDDEYFSIHDELWCAARLTEPDLSEALRLLYRLNLMSQSDEWAGWEHFNERSVGVKKYCAMVDGFLCVGCLEVRLGYRLGPEDFNQEAPVNTPELAGSDRLWSRLTGMDETQRGLTA